MRRGVDTANGEAAYCAHCRHDCPEGPDVCLGTLEGVVEACCGHGWMQTPYVLFDNDERLEGRNAIAYFFGWGVGPLPVETVSVEMFEQYDWGVVVKAEYEYATLRLVAVRWFNSTLHEPRWSFDGVEATLTNGKGTVPLPELFCRMTESGLVELPFLTVELMADGS